MRELRLIAAIRNLVEGRQVDPRIRIGIGDDAAVLERPEGCVVATTDTLVDGVHFKRAFCGPGDIGARAVAVNLSDLAAMASRPLALLVSLEIPDGLQERFLLSVMRGAVACGERFGATVAGGNITRSPGVFAIGVTALGTIPKGFQPWTRSGARPGDVLVVSGSLGSGALGLHLLDHHPALATRFPGLVRAYRRPTPRLDMALLHGGNPGVHAAIDLSDGLGSDIRHITRASGVGARVDISRLPILPEAKRYAREVGLDPYWFALSGGDDYELLLAIAPGDAPAMESKGFTRIGRITGSRGLRLVRDGARIPASLASGYRHDDP
jgi:thiamine-monophosphate kinase